MEKRLNISFKDAWIAINGILLSVSTISWMVGAENLFGVCGTLLMLLSFPFNLLFGWLFFAFDNFYALPGMVLLMLFIFSAVGYFQWIILVPRMVKFIRSFFTRDLEIEVNLHIENTKQITEPSLESFAQDWQINWYDEHKHTPVERVFNHDIN